MQLSNKKNNTRYCKKRAFPLYNDIMM